MNWFIGVLTVTLLPVAINAEDHKAFRAGAATANITPWMGLSIEGNMHDHKGTNIHDELHARALVIDDGKTRLAFAIADNCLIPRAVFDEAKEIIAARSGLAPENVLMAATHAHSAPAAVGIYQATADPEYKKFLTRRLADAVLEAMNHLEPALIGWGKGVEPRYVSNRRWKLKPGITNVNLATGGIDAVRMNPRPGSADLVEPAGPVDPEVSVLAVKSPAGKPIAVLANYSMHYVGDVGGDGIVSADYFGAFCKFLAEKLNTQKQEPAFVAMLSNGTSGDCNSTDFRHGPVAEPAYTKINRVANAIASVACGVYGKMEFHDWVELRHAQTQIELAVRKANAKELEAAKLRLASAVRLPNGQLRPWTQDIYAQEAVKLDSYPDRVPLILQAFRIGDLVIDAIPCEVFAEIGLDIKKRSPFQQTFTIELANGYNGYLPTPAQHKLGGYETWRARSSYLEADASTKISKSVFDLFERLR
jgi:hypothetical protein